MSKSNVTQNSSIWVSRILTVIILVAVFYYAKLDVQAFLGAKS